MDSNKTLDANDDDNFEGLYVSPSPPEGGIMCRSHSAPPHDMHEIAGPAEKTNLLPKRDHFTSFLWVFAKGKFRAKTRL